MSDLKAAHDFAEKVDYGKVAAEYGKFRPGFPELFFNRVAAQVGLEPSAVPFTDLTEQGGIKRRQMALDIGTGTGTVARGLARLGLAVTGVDPAPPLLEQAMVLAKHEGLIINFEQGRAEELRFADRTFDIVIAGQCWHWFDRQRAATEAFRVLRPGGRLVIAHFDRLPRPGNVVVATEALILEFNSSPVK